MDETINVGPERPPVDVAEFKNSVAKADGRLIPLQRRSAQGTSLFIETRYIGNPYTEESQDADKSFHGWAQERHGVGAFTGVLIVDTYSQEGSTLVPIGHKDWWLQGDYANGGGNMHAAAVPRSAHERLSLEQWGGLEGYDAIAFKLKAEYQHQKIGSLMIATSSVALASLGITRFYSGASLAPSIKTWAHFGITPNDYVKSDNPEAPRWMRQLPIERLAQHPHVDEVIEHFLPAGS